jgi:3-oxoacyl-[acyl-carrier protein] reductase
LKRLQGKVAIVTGGSRGIGAGIAKRFAREGAAVVVNYLSNEAAAQKVIGDIQGGGGRALALRCDVSDFKEVQTMVSQSIDVFQGLDILVNNAGILRGEFVQRENIREWLRVIEVNLLGTLNCSKAAIDHLKRRGGGRIINCSSISGRIADVDQSAYGTSKVAIEHFSRVLAGELAPYNITVNVYAPGVIVTDMTKGFVAESGNQWLNQVPLQRFGKPDDVANVVLFLASEESSYVTGAVIPVDGGIFIVQDPWRAKEFADKDKSAG